MATFGSYSFFGGYSFLGGANPNSCRGSLLFAFSLEIGLTGGLTYSLT